MATLDKDNKKKSGPEKPQQPLQPGMMMWEAGIMYFSDGFDSNTTKPVIQAIIEKNLLPLKLLIIQHGANVIYDLPLFQKCNDKDILLKL